MLILVVELPLRAVRREMPVMAGELARDLRSLRLSLILRLLLLEL